MDRPAPPDAATLLPEAPVLAAGARSSAWVTPDGEIERLSPADAALRAEATPPILCHAKATAKRLGTAPFAAFDVLELFAFARPAQFCLPTARGLARVLGLAVPENLEAEAECLLQAAHGLLQGLTRKRAADPAAGAIARVMSEGGWPWGPAVLAALGEAREPAKRERSGAALKIWTRLKEWSEHAPEPPPGHLSVSPEEALERLALLLGPDAEHRPEQRIYTADAAGAFAPAEKDGEPQVVIAEAGTGVGKTLGYVAPASVWAEKNEGPVWISTFTRNLQRQLDAELDKLYPDAAEKALRAVVRKGRENYLCLLNMEEAVNGLGVRPQDAIGLGLVARWGLATRDGDMVGGDIPAWLNDLLGYRLTLGLTDTRGECIYSSCTHYGKCFIERSIRRARRARIVIANHALVLIQAALGGGDDAYLPTRYVFDEGHHLFDAADSAFSAHLTGGEAAELRRWLLGAEGRRRSRARGLKARIEDLVAADDKAMAALDEALRAARFLPGEGWHERLAAGNPVGPVEEFLVHVRQQVFARDPNAESPYDLEAETQPPIPGLLAAATELEDHLASLGDPLKLLIRRLTARLDDEADELDTQTRQRIEAVNRSLERRGVLQLQAWHGMLEALAQETPAEFVDWFNVTRSDGRETDIGMHRNWLDPTLPFAERVVSPAHGVLMTSATLRDGTGDEDADWAAAEARTGGDYLARPPILAGVSSPFDYASQTRVLVVTDVNKNDPNQVAAAYRELMLAAGGGAIGLFTSIARLRAVHARLAGAQEFAELMLLAQHVDALDTGTLIDIFRAEEDSILLGTDAVRDGVDIPGRALRMIVFDRVPWPRPTILHRARKAAYTNGKYDDMLTRLRLKQAFGRLIRRADDHGVFVMLDRAMPSRLAGAFPDGVEIELIGLAEAGAAARDFLG